MFVVTTETIVGYPIVRVLGLVQGNTVRTKDIGRDIGASFKSLVGGEIRSYTEMMAEARTEAMQRLVGEATALGANAIVNLRFATADILGSAAEILAYGTAVVVQPAEAGRGATAP